MFYKTYDFTDNRAIKVAPEVLCKMLNTVVDNKRNFLDTNYREISEQMKRLPFVSMFFTNNNNMYPEQYFKESVSKCVPRRKRQRQKLQTWIESSRSNLL